MAYDSYVITDGDRDNEGITVECTLSIRVGNQFHISGSYGYAGICPGIVKVVGMIAPGCEAHRSNVEWNTAGDEDGRYLEQVGREPVIKYQYQGGVTHDTTHEDGYDYLPLAVFLDHISTL